MNVRLLGTGLIKIATILKVSVLTILFILRIFIRKTDMQPGNEFQQVPYLNVGWGAFHNSVFQSCRSNVIAMESSFPSLGSMVRDKKARKRKKKIKRNKERKRKKRDKRKRVFICFISVVKSITSYWKPRY